ncbi:MAG: sigma 54-interacting transcriptional regulator [Myxococcota bacterium]
MPLFDDPSKLRSRPSIAEEPDPHLSILRELLHRNYLHRADWRFALGDLARMVREALNTTNAFVAIYEASNHRWSTVDASGERISSEAIAEQGSLTILEEVRQSREPILTTGAEPLKVNSVSLMRHEVERVMAVPLTFWDVMSEQAKPHIGGCIYAHRTADQPSFTEDDVELVLDISRIAEPTLNLLRHIRALEDDLVQKDHAIAELRRAAQQIYRLGNFETHDSWFAQHVVIPLSRLIHADRVGLLILGPTGSGKSHLARAFHYASQRRNRPFVTFDCAQVTSETTLAAELFGYAANSGYANAPSRGRPGKARLANGGTLFIDEIGSMPGIMQGRLLRLVQEGSFSPLGSSEEVKVDIQVIAATNEDLKALVGEGRFREDLYWRLGEFVVTLPSLNGRVSDIPHLAQIFLTKARQRFKRTDLRAFTDRAMYALVTYDWATQGNLRGLEHVISRAVVLTPPDSEVIDLADLQFTEVFEYGRGSVAPTGPARSPLAPALPPTSGGFSAPSPPPLASNPTAAPTAAVSEPQNPSTFSAPPPTTAAAAAQPWSHPQGAPPNPPLPSETLRALLIRKLDEHEYTVKGLAQDPELAVRLDHEHPPIPLSTLYHKIQELDLKETLEAGQERLRQQLLDATIAAIHTHKSGAAAARALGISRDTLVGRLRSANLTISDVLSNM